MNDKSFEIRGVTFGEGSPVIAVPVSGKEEDILADISAVRECADMIEIRMDGFEELRNPKSVSRLLRRARGAFDGPVLLTLRTRREGGLVDCGDGFYEEVLTSGIMEGNIDLVDVEFAFGQVARRIADMARNQSVKVVMSQHDFHHTPDSGEILDAFRRMYEMGADIAKGAYIPQDGKDVDEVLAAALAAGREFQMPFALISMGEAGRITRTDGETFGSCLTFASAKGKNSAPGQIDVMEMREILARRHETLSERKNVFLIGFMGAGKTSVSEALGDMTGIQVVEMDRRIEEEHGMSIPEIFERFGEEHFRNLETDLLSKLRDEPPSVVSCGGGAVLRMRNVVCMKGMGRIVLLDVSAEEVLRRLADEVAYRPNLRERFTVEGIRELQAARREAYEGAADIVVSTDGKRVREIAEEIALRPAGTVL
ncbi:MAG: type I 3-dehydroquinate dehydratase, partial [Lachnospiraceae bacterium]|nr:type I 3-dehydroquinate dehydratase [Lachnospiraceae bacterium]